MWDDETAWLKNKIFVVEKRTKTEDDKKVKTI